MKLGMYAKVEKNYFREQIKLSNLKFQSGVENILNF